MLSRRPPLLPAGERSAPSNGSRGGGVEGWKGRGDSDGCWVGPIYFSQGPFHMG